MLLESERVMVFEDPLALSPLHFCAIPTTAYIPDWRFMTLRPKDGLAITQELVQPCREAAEEQFLSDKVWCGSLLATGFFDAADMLMGYNYPPSQNQLHVQYMLPVLMPHQYTMFLRGVHYTPQHFFPVAFVQECLQKLVQSGAHLDRTDLDLPVEELLDVLKSKCGVNYDEAHAVFMAKADEQQKRFANWQQGNFGGVCRFGDGVNAGDLLYESFDVAGPHHGKTVAEHIAYDEEKKILQNYGKNPTEGATAVGYYSFPKELGQLDMSFLSGP